MVWDWFSPRIVRRLYWLRDRDPVPEELRGWSWSSPPVRPRGYFGLGVSEVAYRYCPVFRDLWLRRKLGLRPRVDRGSPLFMGRVVHEVIHSAVGDVRMLVSKYRSLPMVASELFRLSWKRTVSLGCSGCREARELYLTVSLSLASRVLVDGGDSNPLSKLPFTEYVVDGSPLGLSSRLRVDAVAESGLVVEYKLASDNGYSVDRYSVGIAGYALALESMHEVPYDYGVLVLIKGLSGELKYSVYPIYISSVLRRRFLDNRDDAIDVLLTEAPPPVPKECPRTCPFYSYCHGGDDGR